MTTHTAVSIRWSQIFALALLNIAIVISWMAYHNFQPILIKRFHFEHLETFVHVAQALVMVLVPLLAGKLADHYKGSKGSSFTIFAIGISIASMLFMSVAFTISDQTFLNLAWLLPVLIILWLISMNIFHSPANAIVEAFIRNPLLPLIMAVLAISKQVVLGMEPLIVQMTNWLGGTYTFVIGGTLLIITGLFFGYATKSLQSHVSKEEHDGSSQYGVVLIIGLLSGLCHSLLVHFFPALLYKRFGEVHTLFHEHLYLSIIFWIAALSAIPLSLLVKRVGIRSMLLFSVCLCFISMIPIIIFENHLIAGIFSLVLAFSYSMMSVTAFPYALLNVSERNVIFGTGIFFACFELPEVVFSFLH